MNQRERVFGYNWMNRNGLLVLAAVLLGSIIAYRSVVIPFTHDEASTWLNYRHLNVWTCLTNKACWGTANNHWLNTLLLQGSAGLFGDHAWALRLPNVIGGFLYLAGAGFIAHRYLSFTIVRLAGFLLLSAFVYLLDFFSLARGYGLMACGVIWGIYGLMRYTEHFSIRWLVLSIFGLLFSILANFTGLLPWATLGATWMVWVVLHKKYDLLLRHGSVWALSAVALLILLWFPIKTLSQSGEFTWGAKGLWEMMVDLFTNLLYGSYPLSHHTIPNLIWGLLVVYFFILAGAFFLQKRDFRKPVYLSFMLLFFCLVTIVLQQITTGAQAPIGRKSIFLIPFVFLPVVLGLSLIKNKMLALLPGVLISVVLIYHMHKSLHWAACREWYYDANYPELFATIFPEGPDSDSIRLGASWIFFPSLTFYQQTCSLPFTGLDYQKQLMVDTSMSYYYIDPGDKAVLDSGEFVLEKNIGLFLLYKRSPPVISAPMKTEE